MSSPSGPYQGMSDLALPLCDPCLEMGGPGMYPPVADLMYLSSETAGDLDLESRKLSSKSVILSPLRKQPTAKNLCLYFV